MSGISTVRYLISENVGQIINNRLWVLIQKNNVVRKNIDEYTAALADNDNAYRHHIG
jgi:hypothetical protein